MRLSEIYTSVQGEGPGAGHMTQFIRFAGCNLRCPGWPCDTQHAIDPKLYRKEWEKVTVDDILQRVQDYPKRVTLTGGEPGIQPLAELDSLIDSLTVRLFTIEVFTNGTTDWPNRFGYWIPNVRIIMDWKLQGSGEDPLNETRLENLKRLGSKDAVKFVIKDENDFNQAVHLWQEFVTYRTNAQVYYGAVWGAVDNAKLVEWVQREQLDWKLNVQMHNYIWDRDQRGI